MINLPTTFKQYLTVEGNSAVTVKNYLSDLNHFLAWLDITLKSQNLPYSEGEPFFITRYFDSDLVQKYRAYLLGNQIPTATVNRRLSTLRTFAKFCLSQGWLQSNPTDQIRNSKFEIRNSDESSVNPILLDFKRSLEKQGTSPNTIKNYISDIREYLVWLESETVQ